MHNLEKPHKLNVLHCLIRCLTSFEFYQTRSKTIKQGIHTMFRHKILFGKTQRPAGKSSKKSGNESVQSPDWLRLRKARENISKNVATRVSNRDNECLFVKNLKRQTKCIPTNSWNIRSVNVVYVFIPASPCFLCRRYLQIQILLSF